jgi:hypothetical protein
MTGCSRQTNGSGVLSPVRTGAWTSAWTLMMAAAFQVIKKSTNQLLITNQQHYLNLQPVSMHRLRVHPKVNNTLMQVLLFFANSNILYIPCTRWRHKPLSVPNFNGPSATRKECHILLNRESEQASIHRAQKFSNLHKASLMPFICALGAA